MNKWVNPSSRIKADNKFPQLDGTNCIFPSSFDIIKKQVGKKKVSKKSKKERIADKSILLADRFKSETYK